jgi:hypothetical protein
MKKEADRFRGGMLVASTLLLMGCHTYVPVQQPVPGTSVRVRVPLTSAAQRPNQAPETVSIEGTLIEFGDTVEVEVTSRQEYGAFREVMRLDTLRIAAIGITGLDERTFSRGRSVVLGLVIGGAAAAFAWTALGFEGGGSNPEPGPDGPQPSFLLSPIVRTIWGLIHW